MKTETYYNDAGTAATITPTGNGWHDIALDGEESEQPTIRHARRYLRERGFTRTTKPRAQKTETTPATEQA